MRTSRSLVLAALAVALLLVSVPLALAAPGGGGAGAKLTIKAWNDGAMGEIVGAGKDCSAGRPVFVYAQQGTKPDPKADKRIGKAGAKRTGTGKGGAGSAQLPFYLWLAAAKSSEAVYAETGPRKGCAELRSRTISLPPRDVPIRDCPETTQGQGEQGEGFCRISLHLDASVCPGFSREMSLYPCTGKIWGNVPWQILITDLGYGTYGDFRWIPTGPNGERRVVLQTMVTFAPLAGIEGFMKGPQYAEFYVDRAWSIAKGATFVTPRSPIRAGEVGGPLYLDFRNGTTGADVYVRGYLLRVR